LKHSYCINIIGGFFFSYQVQKIEFGRLSYPPQEAAWKMQNKEKRFKDLLWAFRAASSSNELPAPPPLPPPVLPLAKVSAAITSKIVFITFLKFL
jgi:hypothetical protein